MWWHNSRNPRPCYSIYTAPLYSSADLVFFKQRSAIPHFPPLETHEETHQNVLKIHQTMAIGRGCYLHLLQQVAVYHDVLSKQRSRLEKLS